MRTYFNTILCIAMTVVLATVRLADAEEPLKLERLPLSANDISSVTGLNIYKFRVGMKPGTKFDVTVSVLDAPDAKPRLMSRQTFRSNDDVTEPDLLLSFLSRDNSLRGVLLSQDEEIVYRVECPQCSPTGIATIISLPLSDIPGTRKTLIPMTADQSAKLSDTNEVCLIAILAADDGKAVSMQRSYPRAKISLTFAD